MTRPPITTARAGVLDIAFGRHGDADGWPVVLLHGFPYDARCYDSVAPALAEAGADVVVPYLRGFGATRFFDSTTMRSGQQAALAVDLRELIATLGLTTPIVAGYDHEFDSTAASFDNADFVAHEQHFSALLDVRAVRAGHNVPQEDPPAFVDAVLHAHRNS